MAEVQRIDRSNIAPSSKHLEINYLAYILAKIFYFIFGQNLKMKVTPGCNSVGVITTIIQQN
jgi:hypothetical protein